MKSMPPPRTYFNPRSPWGERLYHTREQYAIAAFQSTLPVGGATQFRQFAQNMTPISIHAPRGGSDRLAGCTSLPRKQFQSTLPVGGATTKANSNGSPSPFQSTLPVGGATSHAWHLTSISGFQSTLPVGGATTIRLFRCTMEVFQSTLPVGGATSLRDDLVGIFPRYFNPRSPWGERRQNNYLH